jgi:heme exporter protein D
MQFDSFTELLHMGGHGAFVWSVYFITLVVVIGNVLIPLRQKKRFYLEQAARSRRDQSVEALKRESD